MTIFTIGRITIVCDSKSRRGGFKHTATLLIGGYECDRAKCLYVNRTWECFQYASVLQKLIQNTDALTKRQKSAFTKKFISGRIK